MIKPKALSDVLAGACSAGVQLALLAHSDGSLVAYAGSLPERDAHTHAALSASAWAVYDKNSTPMLDMHVTLESAVVYAVRTSPVLSIVLVAEPSADLGLVRQKARGLREYLEGPLRSVAQA
ncbi:hypothetical protein BCR44DRAFT_23654 [Catenaria anguillulae PL171]|uniref:Roadblock/LAMTOR2 domain-containing protein n=1 Tax=Catenaria anguillulae PL171 TaxID=765915 RepID=A0A1Y2HWS0_9FUNG|nr:hypothetical protein BCR44DRAFT_23654 [Catenaria anguillulae PL171]